VGILCRMNERIPESWGRGMPRPYDFGIPSRMASDFSDLSDYAFRPPARPPAFPPYQVFQLSVHAFLTSCNPANRLSELASMQES
jgi:hypothetical protein